jgi:hypothetical protein
MARYLLPAVFLAWVLAASGQTDPVAKSDEERYQAFFSKLTLIEAALKTPGSPITTKVGETLSLSESQVRDMNTLAAECVAQQAAAFRSLRAVTLEARLQSIATGKVDAKTAGQLRLAQLARESIMADAVVRLRNLVGEAAFQTVDRFVRLQESSGFPNLSDYPKPTPDALKK